MRLILAEYSRSDCDKAYNSLQKLRTNTEKLNQAYSKFHKPLKYLAGKKVTVKFRDTIIFRQYIPKQRKSFHIKIYKPHEE
jgi:GH25 family lysozyme M1 (1,4-beta-N-acetylmuramidase)